MNHWTEGRLRIVHDYIITKDMLTCIRTQRGPAERAMINMVMKMVEQEQEKYLQLVYDDTAPTQLPTN